MPKRISRREINPDKLTELQRLSLEALKGELRVVRACGALDKVKSIHIQADRIGDIIDAIDAALLRDKQADDSS